MHEQSKSNEIYKSMNLKCIHFIIHILECTTVLNFIVKKSQCYYQISEIQANEHWILKKKICLTQSKVRIFSNILSEGLNCMFDGKQRRTTHTQRRLTTGC